MNKLKLMIATGLLLVPFAAMATATVMSEPAAAVFSLKGGANDARGDDVPGGITSGADAGQTVKKVVNIILWVVGIISVVMLIWGGIKYATSSGDSGKVTSAKNTILYALVGLLVALFAYALVNFVITGASSTFGT